MEPLITYKGNWNYPVILGGRRSFIITSRNGILSIPWSRYGPKIDFGGLYVPPIRATGPVIPLIRDTNGIKSLGSHIVDSEYYGSHMKAHYTINNIKIISTLFTPTKLPAATIILEMKGELEPDESKYLDLYIESWGGPVEYDGILPEKTAMKYINHILSINTGDWDTVILSNTPPVRHKLINNINTTPEKIKGTPSGSPHKIKAALLSWDIHEVISGGKLILSMVSSDKGYRTTIHIARNIIRGWEKLLGENITRYTRYLETTTRIETPSRELNQAYDLARAALETLKSQQPESGVDAGYPWFARFWSRDAAWIIPTLILIGDVEYARDYIDLFLKYQAHANYKTLGGKKGEVLMHYGYKTLFYYGAADSTLYFPILIHKYVVSSGDTKYLRRRWKNIIDLINWGCNKDIDGDGLLEHILEEPAKFFFIDTTWMDTIYRGTKPIEIQALWAASLIAAAELADIIGNKELSIKWVDEGSTVAKKIISNYWNRDEEYFYDRITERGIRDPSIRPNALLVLYYLNVPVELARKVLDRLEKPDMLTNWGLRTLSAKDEKYSPEKYHNGMVWPLITGWLALTEYKYDRKEAGYKIIDLMARQILREGGMYAEVYRGDREEPMYSCILQAWSITLFIQAILEGMLGIKIDAINKKLYLCPRLPRKWDKVKIFCINIAKNKLDIEMNIDAGKMVINNHGTEELYIDIYGEAKVVKPGVNNIEIK